MEGQWSAKQILSQLCDADLRRRIVASFWRHGESQSKQLAAMQLAKSLRFREQTIRSAPPEKKADWLLTRAAAPEFEEALEMALMLYHTHDKSELLAAFLDEWKVPHVNGTIETDEYTAPSREDVERSVETLRSRFDLRDITVYLASLGLLMGESEKEWRQATWPVVDQLAATATSRS
jgi:hypothetical protein